MTEPEYLHHPPHPRAGPRDPALIGSVGSPSSQHDEEQGLTRDELLAGVQRLLGPAAAPDRADRPRGAVEANPDLLGVANMAVGFNNIDVDVATELGIPVSNTPGVLTETTADLTWALLLERRATDQRSAQLHGRRALQDLGTEPVPRRRRRPWRRRPRARFSASSVTGASAPRWRDARSDSTWTCWPTIPTAASGSTPTSMATWADLPELLAEERLRLAPPAVESGDPPHLIGEAELRMMKSTAFLINAARGDRWSTRRPWWWRCARTGSPAPGSMSSRTSRR